MKPAVRLPLLLGLVLSAAANPVLVRESEALTPSAEQAALHVPDGFEIRLFASEPMINKPINLAWDVRGRLWVSSTVEYPYAAVKDRWADPQGSRVRDSRDAIKILEDTDGDGSADKVTSFADGLNIPTGVLPWHKPEHKDGCIAWSIPNIWYFADTDGDGTADHREVLFGPLGWERDTHGMCSSFRLGPDGWIYATHGFNNTSHFKAADGSTLELNSGNVFRFRPDGSRIEPWSRGQVNPFGLSFDHRGNLYSADCHSAPVYQLLRGAVYPSFGKPHDGIGFGPTMIEHTHGSTGICGIAYLDRNRWGTEWNDHLLIGNPVTSRVNHDRLEFAGSTPVAVEQPDFVTSDDPWFRPVDLCFGDDHALYVADFYNRIIGHYEVPLDHPGRDRERGRIWRIVKKDVVPVKLAPLPAPATYTIADLRDESAFTRRAAAAHFQIAPTGESLAPLLELLERTPPADTHLRHVVRMAIREHLKHPWGLTGTGARPVPPDLALATPSPAASEYLLRHLALNPGADESLRLAILTHSARYGTPDSLPRAIELARKTAGGPPLAQAGFLGALVQGLEERGELTQDAALLAWARELALPLLDEAGESLWQNTPHPSAPRGDSPWGLEPRQCADGTQATVLSSLPARGGKTEQLTGVLRSEPFKAPGNLAFWICGHRGAPDQAAHEKNLVRLVDAASGAVLRRALPPRSDICQRVAWDLADQENKSVRFEIIDGDDGDAYAWLGVTRIEPAVVDVESFQGPSARTKALQQLAVLLKITAPADLRDRLRPWLPAAPAPAPLPVSPQERARLDQLIAERAASFAKGTPDPIRGKALFTTHCAACHQIAGAGTLLGPQLDGIGKRGTDRLCEDILDPSRNVDAHFYLTTFKLKDGSATTGFIRSESGAILNVVDATGADHRLAKDQIASQASTPLSLMPPTFGQSLSEAEFNQLLAWLLLQ